MTATPLSLYLDLEEGQVADMEVVAAAAIAFSRAIKELAYILDPTVEIRVELESGTEGSLSLNSLVRVIKGLKNNPGFVAGVAGGAVMWFLGHVGDYAFDQVADLVKKHVAPEQAEPLSDDDINRIATRVVTALQAGAAKPQVQGLYRELERDSAIKGVGISSHAGKKPDIIVPRADFPERAGIAVTRDVTVERRIAADTVHVILIRPVLVAGERRWTFRSPHGDFGATIKDKDFLERVLAGTLEIPLAAGIEMDVDLETTEELRNGVWTPLERHVLKVRNVRKPPSQGDLLLAPSS